jgi:HD-GYP domain-containing protein (c-di-GMP phosphodiesterase class II)
VQNNNGDKTQANKTRLDLLDKICGNVRSVKQHLPVISCIAQTTRYALNASASSLILLDDKNPELLNKYTDGPLGKQFKRLHLNNQLGLTRWVIRNGKPRIVNDTRDDEDSNESRNEVAGVVPRSVICVPLVINRKVAGAIEVLNKLDGNNFNDNDAHTLAGMANSAALTIENIRLNENLLYSYKDTVQKLVSLFDVRESTAGKHSKRVAEYALMAAAKLSLSDDEKKVIEYAAILHDIGLLSVPESVLNKSGKLTRAEWDMIRAHPVIGYNLLRGIPSLNQVSKLILYHHERFDGKGYPCGLKGDTIPIGARVIAVADAFDSMTVKHSYRAAMSPRDALAEIGKCAGSQFCPVVAKVFFVAYLKTNSSGKVNFRKKAPV